MEYDYDPLLDYCEDYAWDPSDSDPDETEDHTSLWDLSDMGITSKDTPSVLKYLSHDSSKTVLQDSLTIGQTIKDGGSVAPQPSTDTASVFKYLPHNSPKTHMQDTLAIGQTVKDEGSVAPQQSRNTPFVFESLPQNSSKTLMQDSLMGQTVRDGLSPKEAHRVPLQVELDTGIFQVKEIHKEGNYSSIIGSESLIYILFLKYYGVTKKALRLGILKLIKWVFFKWIFVVLNVMIEGFQATFTQENARGKISTSFYRKLSIITSLICLIISIIETIHEGKVNKVVWRSKNGCFGWFYHPGRQRRLFGRFSQFFGVVSSLIQLCINLVALLINKDYLKFDLLPLLVSSGYLIAALINIRRKNVRKSKCKVREKCHLQCSKCKVRLENESFGFSSIQFNSNFPYSVDESYGSESDPFRSYSSLLSIKIQ